MPPVKHRPRHRLAHVVVGVILSVVMLEACSGALLFLISLRGGDAASWFPTLLPHPALATHLNMKPWKMFTKEGSAELSSWHPLLGYYKARLLHGEERPVATFAPDELAVYLLGGSTVEGDGASRRETTIAARLEQRLRDQLNGRFHVLVINEGISGYMSVQELTLLVTKILPFGNPHYVVDIDGYNDWVLTVYNRFQGMDGVTDEMWPHPEFSWHMDWVEKKQSFESLFTVRGAAKQLLAVASRGVARHVLAKTYTGWLLSHARNWTRYRLLPRFGAPDPLDYASYAGYERTPVLPRERAAFHAMNARIMAEACRARGCRFFWVLQPILPCRAPMAAQEQRQYEALPPAFWQSLQQYYADLLSVVGEDADYWNARFVDLSCPAYSASEPLFFDRVHLTEAGHEYVAQRVADIILKDLARSKARAL